MTLKLADGVPGVTGSGTYDPFPGVSGTSLVPHPLVFRYSETRLELLLGLDRAQYAYGGDCRVNCMARL